MKKLIFSIFLLGLITIPAVSKAVTSAELQIQINALLQQIQALQAQLTAQQATTPTTPTTTTPTTISTITTSCPNLTYNLYLGLSDSQTGGQVSQLQRFLAQDSSIYPEGEVSGYFGTATERAVQRWQAKYRVVSSGTPATTGYGSVGPRTRTAIAAICRTSIPATGATATTTTAAATTGLSAPIFAPTPDPTPAKATEDSSVSSTFMEGYLTTVIEDDFENHRADVKRYLKRTDVPGEEVIEILGGDQEAMGKIPPGSTVRVSGGAKQGKTLMSPSIQTAILKGAPSYAAAPSSLTTGVKKVAVFFVKFADAGDSYATVEEARVTLDIVNDYYRENSYGKISFEFTIDEGGWITLPSTVPCSERTSYYLTASKFRTMIPSNFSLADYYGVFFILDTGHQTVCNLSSRGGSTVGQSAILANPPIAASRMDDEYFKYFYLLNDYPDLSISKYNYFYYTPLPVLFHELGHSLKLEHANLADCGNQSLASSGCVTKEYGDVFDIMGYEYGAHFNAAKKDALGWFSSADILTINPSNVTTAQTFTLKPIESDASGLKTVKIARDVPSTYYYLEYRQPIGYDRMLNDQINNTSYPSNINKGLSLRIAPMIIGSGGNSQLIDTIPVPDPSWTRNALASALEPGKPFNFPGIGLTLEVLSACPEGATARIYKTSSPPTSTSVACAAAVPVNRSPTANAGLDQTVNENILVTLNGSGSDPDSDPLTYSWTAPAGITLSNSQTANPTFTAPSVSADTNYTFTLVVNDGTLDSPSDSVVIAVRNISVSIIPTATNLTVQPSAYCRTTGGQVTFLWTYSDPENQTQTARQIQIDNNSDFSSPIADNINSTSFPMYGNYSSGNAIFGGVFTQRTTYYWRIKVKNADNWSDWVNGPSFLVPDCTNRPPTVNAGPDQIVHENDIVTLQGTASDPDGDALTYLWTSSNWPPGAPQSDSVSSIGPLTFTAPTISADQYTYTFTLSVQDGRGGSASDIVRVTIVKSTLPGLSANAQKLDYNNDGILNVSDWDFLTDVLLGKRTCPADKVCDVNQDGKSATIGDVQKLGNIINGTSPVPDFGAQSSNISLNQMASVLEGMRRILEQLARLLK